MAIERRHVGFGGERACEGRALAPDRDLAIGRLIAFQAAGLRDEPVADHLAPGLLLGLVAVRPVGRDHQAVLGAGHGDVEQPVVLLVALGVQEFARLRHRARIGIPAWRPDRDPVAGFRLQLQQRRIAAEHLAAVDEHHDGRLEAFRAVHGHHAHLVAHWNRGRA